MTWAEDNWKKARGYLTLAERECLYSHAKQIEDGETIINIGVQYGASIACLAAGNPSVRIIGVDIDLSKYELNIDSVQLIEDSSKNVLESWHWAAKVALAFIDGDHGYRGVRGDTGWSDFVRPGGHIIFHDCCDKETGQAHHSTPGVGIAVSEWFESVLGWVELEPVGSMRIFRKRK